MAGGAFPLYLGARKTHYVDDVAGEPVNVLTVYEDGKWAAEPKIDGQWCCVFVDSDGLVKSIVSRWGKKKDDVTVDGLIGLELGCPDSILIGELEAGSQVSTEMFRKLGYRRVHLFDVVKAYGESTVYLPLEARRNMLKTIQNEMPDPAALRMPVVKQWNDGFEYRFRDVVLSGGEGLMLKRRGSSYLPDNPDSKSRKFGAWVKAKKLLTREYVVCREVAAEKGGRGAKLGLFVKGKLKEVMQMQMPPEVLDRCHAEGLFRKMVIEAKGCERFKSGALRHAQFVRVREGRPPESCQLEDEY